MVRGPGSAVRLIPALRMELHVIMVSRTRPAPSRRKRGRAECALLALLIALPAAADDWTHAAGDAARSGQSPRGPHALARVKWTAPPASDEEFIGPAAPIVHGGLVLVPALRFEDNVQTGNRLVAFSIADGERAWAADLDPDTGNSWSTAAIDPRNHVAVIATGNSLYGIALADGAIAWHTSLTRPVVNASPAISTDLENAGSPANRAFITDFGGGSSTLYAVNLDPFDVANPFQPGDIAWSATLPGGSGNSPAYDAGRVYVASRGNVVRAYDARTGGAPLWSTPTPLGFFGGVTVRDGFVYGATYNFSGAQNNSRLYKLNAASGAVAWYVACERTDSIPIVASGGKILLCGGLDGFGSIAKTQCFHDNGASATLQWDTATLPASAPRLGDWRYQPVLAEDRLYVGTPDDSATFAGYTSLSILDTTRAPTDPLFISTSREGLGGSPALAGGNLYSVGPAGLVAISGILTGDANCDGAVNNFDIDWFVLALIDPAGYAQALPNCDRNSADANEDGAVNNFDIDAFVALLVGG